MPELRPFRGLRYDSELVPDLSAVLCPPYDVISPAEREVLAARDPHNAVALELPVVAAGDQTRYEAAARLLDDWRADGVLMRDKQPQIYVYEQRYTLAGMERVARSFFCRLRLEDYGPGSGVRPHEHTLSRPKEDRFRLLEATHVNLSPVLLLYDDGAGGEASAALLDAITSAPPAVRATGPDGVEQRLWALGPEASPEAGELLALAAALPVTIADGHHRYETALKYRDTPGVPAAATHVLALMYDAHSGGLALRPWHRLIGPGPGSTGTSTARLMAPNGESVVDAQDLLARMRVNDPAAPAGTIGMWTRNGGALLTLDKSTSADLDVDVLSSTLPQMIGSTSEELSANGRLTYTADATLAIADVIAGKADVAFLLRPTPVESVLSVAQAGGFMPAKSTYFHPKAATGLVFNPLDE